MTITGRRKYDANDCSFQKGLRPVVCPAVYGGTREKITYSVDLSTGRTEACFVRDMGNALTEAEGLAIEKTDDAVLFHYVDVVQGAKTAIRTYAFIG